LITALFIPGQEVRMTKTYYVKERAENLKLGDLFVDWAVAPVYGEGHRILNIKNKGEYLKVYLDDTRQFNLHPKHAVVIEVLA